jgi:hypothetical protein
MQRNGKVLAQDQAVTANQSCFFRTRLMCLAALKHPCGTHAMNVSDDLPQYSPAVDVNLSLCRQEQQKNTWMSVLQAFALNMLSEVDMQPKHKLEAWGLRRKLCIECSAYRRNSSYRALWQRCITAMIQQSRYSLAAEIQVLLYVRLS